jgi:hypothetical protein
MSKSRPRKDRPKRKQPTNKPKPPPPPARFAVGARVRVKPGTADPDFPDIPLGGWAGTVTEVDRHARPPTYLIEWDQYTLDHMHPVYRNRCERDGLEVESMWLGEADLEPDTGELPVMEQPTAIRTRPLNPKDQDDRVCLALGLTGDDPLPEVDGATLRKYHAYLAAHLSFPFEGSYSEETGPWEDRTYPVTVLGLLGADDWDDTYGLLCEAREGTSRLEVPLAEVEVKKGGPNRQLVEDYHYWFWNWR